ncbi:Ig-like domain-containing protein [Butyrivibrio sp. JL13D10]|uniref:Ig-like domain-containing protein n=1 Tax=Butyrivibrio sp. JL13D10 TaxID=3236815 RepID=UPI0038B4CF1B
MGKRVSFKRIISAALAVVMAATLCIIAMPTYQVEAATKKVSVSLGDDNDVEMKVGARVQIRVKKDGATYGKKSVKYRVTSGKSVVSVSSSGLIKAKKSGDAEIKITDKNGTQTAFIYVEVGGGKNNDDKRKPDKIWLDRAEITLEVGQGYHASVFQSPKDIGGGVSWTSENSDIATVTDGYIRAVGHGDVRIHAQKRGRDACMMVHVN